MKILGIIGFAAAAGSCLLLSSVSAQALTADELVAQYTQLGYRITEIKLDENAATFEVEATVGDTEVEFVVDAVTGAVLKAEAEVGGEEFDATIDPATGELTLIEDEDATEREREAAEEAAEREREAAEEAAEREREAAEEADEEDEEDEDEDEDEEDSDSDSGDDSGSDSDVPAVAD